MLAKSVIWCGRYRAPVMTVVPDDASTHRTAPLFVCSTATSILKVVQNQRAVDLPLPEGRWL